MTQPQDFEASEWRLPAQHRQDIRDVAYGVEESEAGVCTKYLLDELERKGPPPEGDVLLFDAEAFVEQYVMNTLLLKKLFGAHVIDWRERILRSRRAFARLYECGDHHSVGVLHMAYGPPDPITKDWPRTSQDFLGRELVGLVRFTDGTEHVRKMLVRERAIPRPDPNAFGNWFATRNMEPTQPIEETIELARVRERERHYDAVISSGDALRFIFEVAPVPRLPNEEKQAWNDRRSSTRNAEDQRRAAFLTVVRMQASAMLANASRAYHAAWMASKR